MVNCPRCKFQNVAAAAKCLSCGTALGVANNLSGGRATTTRLSRDDLLKMVGAGNSAEATLAPDRAEAPAPRPPVAPPRVPNAAGALAQKVNRANAVAWLVCPPSPPIPVGDAVVTIGRGEDSSLVLAHASVSRCHAIVRAVGKEIHFEDRSTYGSYVNGKRQVSVVIRAGDLLTIGPYEVRVKATDNWQENFDDGSTRPLDTAFRDLPSADAMTGRLEKQPLAEILQALEFNRKTGTLDLVCGEKKGTLVVYEGAPIHATFAGQEGDEAVHQMVAQKTGYYAFRTKVEPGEQTISKSMTGLLLESSRRLDEGPAAPAEE
jgi:pSer/pThr/pTyr-binding forkhead associated (FHA) protein